VVVLGVAIVAIVVVAKAKTALVKIRYNEIIFCFTNRFLPLQQIDKK